MSSCDEPLDAVHRYVGIVPAAGVDGISSVGNVQIGKRCECVAADKVWSVLERSENEVVTPCFRQTGFVQVANDQHCSIPGMSKDLQEFTRLERPQRVAGILRKMKAEGVADRCAILNARMATIEEIERVHRSSHTEEMSNLVTCESQKDIDQVSASHESMYLTRETFD
eukprot:TRINITY_DN38325_c0_g1_i1.p1 TRINITY_DN38325_c0_g1~~TRINITY_DN38325_c0_g1_i1.p1  ORF type:complete len:169 (+),score=32.95 TRINITY_DN38325_c0_g1_i1:56-562(+)